MEFVVSAPGKIILFGEHAVVYGKTAIASCISLRTKGHFTVTPFAAAPTDETVVLRARLQELDIDTQITYAQIRSLDGSLQTDVDQPPSQELLAQVKNVYSSFNNSMEVLLFLYAALKHLSKKEISEELTMSFDSELPLGAGLGSSAAFSVVAAAGLLKYFGLCAGENSSEDDGASALDKINSWAFLAERIFHANPSGVDNAVSTYGHAIVFANRRTAVTEMPSLNIMLVNTCIPRNTKTLVQGVRVRFDSHSRTMSHILDAIDLIGIECVDLFSKSKEGVLSTHELYEKIGTLMDVNQGLLNAINVGHPALDRISWMAKSLGLKAKLTGGGGGGCALILVPDETTQETKIKLNSMLEAEGFQVMQVSIGGAGVSISPA